MRHTHTGVTCHRLLKPKVKVETHSSASVPFKRWVQVAMSEPAKDYRRFLMDKSKWIRTGIIITVVIFLILISSAILKHATIHQVYSYYVDSINRLTGLNKYLIKTAVLLSIIPFIIGLRWYFFSPFNKKRRYEGATILIAIMIMT